MLYEGGAAGDGGDVGAAADDGDVAGGDDGDGVAAGDGGNGELLSVDGALGWEGGVGRDVAGGMDCPSICFFYSPPPQQVCFIQFNVDVEEFCWWGVGGEKFTQCIDIC